MRRDHAMVAERPFSCHIDGKEEGETILFIHGWPDNHTLWRHQVAALSDQFRCVLVTLPNFGPTLEKRAGYNFSALVDRLHRTIEHVRPDNQPVSLITHDWGAYIGYLYEKAHPERIDNIVALDIGGHMRLATLNEAFLVIGYQWTLIGCWLVGQLVPRLGDWLSRKFAGVIRVPRAKAENVRSRFNYPYFYFWRALLLPGARKQLLRHYRPRCPILFIYGGNKPVMFHSKQWIKLVLKTGGRTECLEGGAHWFMETHPEDVNALIKEWLAARSASPSATIRSCTTTSSEKHQ